VRLQGQRDELAWQEFVAIYEPLVYRLARQRGWQDADARELSQEVLCTVATAISRWQTDPARGSFRGWLFQIARNLMINYWKKGQRRAVAMGGSDGFDLLARQPCREDAESQQFELEYRRELFRWAAEQVRGEFREATWDAFWLTCVEGRPVGNVAAQLGISAGAAYVARSRVMARMKRVIQRHLDAHQVGVDS